MDECGTNQEGETKRCVCTMEPRQEKEEGEFPWHRPAPLDGWPWLEKKGRNPCVHPPKSGHERRWCGSAAQRMKNKSECGRDQKGSIDGVAVHRQLQIRSFPPVI